MTPAPQGEEAPAPAVRPTFSWAWTAATAAPIVLAGLVLRAMLARALMPAQAGYLLMLMALCSTACWFGLQLCWRIVRRKNPALWYLFVALLPAAVVGWLGVRGAWVLVEVEEVGLVERELTPLTLALSSGARDWSQAIPSSAPGGLTIWRDGREFLVSVEAGSVDIDGSTLYFDSSLGVWKRFYDGSEGKEARHFEERTSSMPKVWPKPKEP